MESRTARTNPATGLRETWDAYYDVPLVHQKRISQLRLNGQATAVHTVPIEGGLTLDFFAHLKRSDELIVTFPGAAQPGKKLYPLFARIATFKALRAPAFMSFADPTIPMDPDRKMLLSWFLGGPSFDPADAILRAIAKAKGKAGAKQVVFVGGSGGGFPALRLSAMVPGSMAYLHEGTTNIASALPVQSDRYFSAVWPGWDPEQLIRAFPERFDMVRHYRRRPLENFVYYAQSEDDSRFRENHYGPLKLAMGVAADSGVSRSGSRHFVLYKGKVKGHGKVTPGEFRGHFQNALQEWRRWRATQ